MSGFIRLLRTEPAIIAAFLQALLSLAIGLGLHLSAGQTGAIEAAVAAAGGLAVAAMARPFTVSALTGFLSAIGTLLFAFGVHKVSPGLVSEVNALVVTILALVLRMHLTPTALPSRKLQPPSGHRPRIS